MQTLFSHIGIVVAGAAISLVAVTNSVQAYQYEAPWSTPAEYEYQYSMAEGLIPYSYYDYEFGTSQYAPSSYDYTRYMDSQYQYADAWYDSQSAYGQFDYSNVYGYDGYQTHDWYSSSPAYDYSYAPSAMYASQAASAQTAQGYYESDGHWHVPGHVHYYDTVRGAQVFRCAPGDSRWRADEIGTGEVYLDGKTATTATSVTRPACSLAPKPTGTGTVILEWMTTGATTAFIDNGIGHVSLNSGGRMVTPQQSTVYTMTVVNERGGSAQCAANIIVRGTAPVGSQTIVVGGTPNGAYPAVPGGVAGGTVNTQYTQGVQNAGVQQGGQPVQPVQYDAQGNPIQAVTDTAEKVGGNLLDRVQGALGGGQSIWERIRTISLIALGIFIVMAIVLTVMKRMFGGASEGH